MLEIENNFAQHAPDSVKVLARAKGLRGGFAAFLLDLSQVIQALQLEKLPTLD